MSDDAERPFQLVDDDGHVVREWITTHGSLVHFTPEDNVQFRHTVPQDPSVKGLRISVVFREATRFKLDKATRRVYEWDARKGEYVFKELAVTKSK